MAKATGGVKGTGKTRVKIIRSIKSPKTGAYTFKEEMVPLEKVKEFLSK